MPYDIAISFLQDDLRFAKSLKKHLSHFNCFIYSEHEYEIITKDGYNYYHNIFKNEAKCILVLYRDEWGQTDFTGVEESAIKERLIEGGDFEKIIFIKLVRNLELPDYYPHRMIYVDKVKFNTHSIAAAIDLQVKVLLSREPKILSNEEKIINYKNKELHEEKRKKYISSGEANIDLNLYYYEITSSIKDKLTELANKFNIAIEHYNPIPTTYCSVHKDIELRAEIIWKKGNREASDFFLTISINKYSRKEQKIIGTFRKFNYTLFNKENDFIIWEIEESINKRKNHRYLSSDELIDATVEQYVDTISNPEKYNCSVKQRSSLVPMLKLTDNRY